MTQSPIIVGLDQTPFAAAVLAHALRLRAVLGRPLVVVTAVDLPVGELPAEFVSPFDAALESEWRSRIAASMQETLGATPKDAIDEHVIEIKRASTLLCDVARDYQSPLIVVGSHSRRTADAFIGTTAARIVNNAETSVYVCRPWLDAPHAFGRVVVGMDGSAHARTVLASAMKVVAPIDAKMTLVRAVVAPLVVPVDILRQPRVDLERLLHDDATRYLNGIQREVADEILCDRRVRTGAPWNVLVDTAEETNADLVIIGGHGYDVARRVLGTTAARVVNHSGRPVLVVKGEGL